MLYKDMGHASKNANRRRYIPNGKQAIIKSIRRDDMERCMVVTKQGREAFETIMNKNNMKETSKGKRNVFVERALKARQTGN